MMMMIRSAERERGSDEAKTAEDEKVGTHLMTSLKVSTDLEAKSSVYYCMLWLRIDVIPLAIRRLD